ncbi:MAG: HAD family hydrolase [Phycisphaerae bacterium]|nr:HAD family hydrolase [Phycisphaerae bacterium]
MGKHIAVLFDLDGTLLDTIDDLTDAMNAALAACGLPTCSSQACKHFVGDGVGNFVLRAMPGGRRGDASLAARITELFRSAYATHWRHHTRPYEGIPELLDELTARRVAMAVLSNKPDDFTKLIVAELLGRWTFRAVVGQREGYSPKPDPAAVGEIAAQLRLAPAEFLYVGDTGTDMATAVAAGMFPVGALWGFRDAAELTAHGAKVLIAHPAELLGLLQ